MALRRASDFYHLVTIEDKLAALDSAISLCFVPGAEGRAPATPKRSMPVVAISALPPKPGLSAIDGQARLAHDLASIELQATELALRTLIEFPDAPPQFRHQLADVARDEGRHLALCVRAIEDEGYAFGNWPVHLGLWDATFQDDSLIDRVIIVHRYLEGAGLDASASILRRLIGAAPVRGKRTAVREAIAVIAHEEIGHVDFGSRWLRELCRIDNLDAENEFEKRLPKLMAEVPRRERIARAARAKAGFTDREMDAIEAAQKTLKLFSLAEKTPLPLG